MKKMVSKSKLLTIEDFYASRLNNFRRIVVYLPPSYDEEPDKRYPVLYMHAGQRAFHSAGPGTESWNIHKAADRLIDEGLIEELLIVAVAHIRPVVSNEYYHFTAPAAEKELIGCSGLDYEHFLIHDLKPYMDRCFRTLSGPEHTGLIGSSAGGLVTYHTGFRHPEVFGKLIMMSPYFIKALLPDNGEPALVEEKLYQPMNMKGPLKLWFDIGDAEGLFLPSHVRDVVDAKMQAGYRYGDEIGYLLEPDAAHQEADWGERVHHPLLFMFGCKPWKLLSVQLQGDNHAALDGAATQINAIGRYDNGLELSLLDADYTVSDPDVLEVERNGTIKPKKIGSAWVTITVEGFKASRMYQVVEERSPFVRIDMSADIPPEIDAPESIHGAMGMKLTRKRSGHYSGSFLVPRNTGYHFRFTRGFRKFESTADGKIMSNRKFRADRDLTLHYKVERWEDATERRPYAEHTF